MKCNVCGNVVNEGAHECAVCGAKIDYEEIKEKGKKEKFFNETTQIFFVGLIALYLLFYMILNNLIDYGRWAGIDNPTPKALGISGLILGLPMIIGIIGLAVFQMLYIFRSKIATFEKISNKFPFIGFIIHANIVFFTLVLTIWRAAVGFPANDFFDQIFYMYGLQAIHTWLFLIAAKPQNIFPKKPAKPSETIEEGNNQGE
ncbi:MAG: hypothetical protein ACOX56_05710 [Acholeplasmataceae bacterium]|jgi:hypothetical protein